MNDPRLLAWSWHVSIAGCRAASCTVELRLWGSLAWHRKVVSRLAKCAERCSSCSMYTFGERAGRVGRNRILTCRLALHTWQTHTNELVHAYILVNQPKICMHVCMLSNTHNATYMHTYLFTYFTYLRTYLLTHSLITHSLTHSHTHSMEQSPYWEANRFSASQEILLILWNPKVKVHYRIPKLHTLNNTYTHTYTYVLPYIHTYIHTYIRIVYIYFRMHVHICACTQLYIHWPSALIHIRLAETNQTHNNSMQVYI
jgi:hypothetical protein